jgi:hypothetical protein
VSTLATAAVIEVTSTACSASDESSNVGSCAFQVQIQDRTAPALGQLAAHPPALFPASHQLVEVMVTAEAADACDPSPACRVVAVSSSEDDDPSSGHSPDWIITGPLTVALRAEHSFDDCDRIYTLAVECSDGSSNVASGSVAVSVPFAPPH